MNNKLRAFNNYRSPRGLFATAVDQRFVSTDLFDSRIRAFDLVSPLNF